MEWFHTVNGKQVPTWSEEPGIIKLSSEQAEASRGGVVVLEAGVPVTGRCVAIYNGNPMAYVILKDGLLHAHGEPAYYNMCGVACFMRKGEHHRMDGPSSVGPGVAVGFDEYHIKGEEYDTKEEYEEEGGECN